jgi:stearoyl-CoA desaturase (delta-9 desaturase)
MADSTVLLGSEPRVGARDQFAYGEMSFLIGVHLAALAAVWHTNWWAVGVCLLLHAVFGGLGICVGYHRLLTHRSFKCPQWIEYTLALLGSFSLQGKPTDWVAQHRKHHQFPDEAGDPHNARRGFWWSHMLWMSRIPSREGMRELRERYAPDLLRQPFYRFLDHLYVFLTIVLGALLYALGGWAFLVWGIFVRLVLTCHCTWLVNSAAHTFGYKNFDLDDLSTNCWWVALLSYGEGWHNNHHAFPTSARHGLRPWEIDLSYGFIRLLKAVGLSRDVRTPPAEKLKFNTCREIQTT